MSVRRESDGDEAARAFDEARRRADEAGSITLTGTQVQTLRNALEAAETFLAAINTRGLTHHQGKLHRQAATALAFATPLLTPRSPSPEVP